MLSSQRQASHPSAVPVSFPPCVCLSVAIDHARAESAVRESEAERALGERAPFGWTMRVRIRRDIGASFAGNPPCLVAPRCRLNYRVLAWIWRRDRQLDWRFSIRQALGSCMRMRTCVRACVRALFCPVAGGLPPHRDSTKRQGTFLSQPFSENGTPAEHTKGNLSHSQRLLERPRSPHLSRLCKGQSSSCSGQSRRGWWHAPQWTNVYPGNRVVGPNNGG